ncbi:MAG: hypothetical protein ACYC61_22560 [Isosphaeraceae bacterium]
MIRLPVRPAEAGTVDRFRNDFRRRYPERSRRVERSPEPEVTLEADEATIRRLEKLPPEVAVLLMVVGVFGVLLPGPVGSPFLIAGGLALWPTSFRKMEDWLHRLSPRLYSEGIRQLERYLADLERRYPGTTRSEREDQADPGRREIN